MSDKMEQLVVSLTPLWEAHLSAKKAYNRALSSQRCLVKHKIGSIKVFKIIGNRYRNKRKRYALKFSIVTGLVNLNHAVALRERVA